MVEAAVLLFVLLLTAGCGWWSLLGSRMGCVLLLLLLM
jgi:hypothetical protein